MCELGVGVTGLMVTNDETHIAQTVMVTITITTQQYDAIMTITFLDGLRTTLSVHHGRLSRRISRVSYTGKYIKLRGVCFTRAGYVAAAAASAAPQRTSVGNTLLFV